MGWCFWGGWGLVPWAERGRCRCSLNERDGSGNGNKNETDRVEQFEVGASGGLSTARQVPRALEKGGRRSRIGHDLKGASRPSCDGCFPPMEDAEPPRSGMSAGPAPMNLPSAPLTPDDLGPVAFDLSCWTSKQAPVAAGTCLVGGRMRRLCATHSGFSDFRGDRSIRHTVVRSRQHVPFPFHVRGTSRVAAAGLSAARRRDMIHVMSTLAYRLLGLPDYGRYRARRAMGFDALRGSGASV